MTTFRRVPEIPNPELEVQPLSVCEVADDGTPTYDHDCKQGSPLWDAYQAWLALGNTLDAPLVPLATTVKTLANQIDGMVADIYSNWTRFQQEYVERQTAAQAFKDAGYAGDPGVWVSAFATAAGMSNQAAADLILSQSVSLNNALQSLGAQRMRKYEVLGAPDAATAQSTFNDITTQIKTIAAAIQ